eukprot:TRINITY_DN3084_c0_g1_i3.p2 TRINITY_DN3084_c0_g1~~TRINITY_DN3084_c0_g1_i3.p2  ORF type:complete len:233 (-),score=27.83 TRINITY_DN3084_c0_g1_i3:728-1426(-)
MSPSEMFASTDDLVEIASQGIEFIQDAAKQQNGWSQVLNTQLLELGYEGTIVVPVDYAVDTYFDYSQSQHNLTQAEIATFLFVPTKLNEDTIGPVEFTLQKTAMRLIRDAFVETELGDRAYVLSIIPFASSCQDVEFWIVDRILIPPAGDLPQSLFQKAAMTKTESQVPRSLIAETASQRTAPVQQFRSELTLLLNLHLRDRYDLDEAEEIILVPQPELESISEYNLDFELD